MKHIKLAIAAVLLLAGCGGSDPNPTNNQAVNPEVQSGRMRVVSLQTIKDSQGKYRDIVVLEDSHTKREYLAVIGAGVIEMVTTCTVVSKTTVCTEEEQ